MPRKVRLPRPHFGLATMVPPADVAELVNANGSGPCARKGVEVQVLSSASPFQVERGNTRGTNGCVMTPRGYLDSNLIIALAKRDASAENMEAAYELLRRRKRGQV